MRIKAVLGAITLNLIISGCSSVSPSPVIPSYQANFSFERPDIIRFSIFDFTERVALYDNFKNNGRPPGFLWVMPCGAICDNPTWHSPNTQVSYVIIPPVELIQLPEGGGFTRRFSFSQLMTAARIYDLSEIERVRIKVRVFFDSELTTYEDLESDWLFIEL